MIGVNDPLERFVWRLAHALGISDPYEMVRIMPARVLNGWRKFYSIEPFGPVQDDRRAGEIAALIASVYRDKKKRSEPFSPEDFFHSLTIHDKDRDLVTGARPPGQMMQIMETLWLSKNSKSDKDKAIGVDNRKHVPRY